MVMHCKNVFIAQNFYYLLYSAPVEIISITVSQFLGQHTSYLSLLFDFLNSVSHVELNNNNYNISFPNH